MNYLTNSLQGQHSPCLVHICSQHHYLKSKMFCYYFFEFSSDIIITDEEDVNICLQGSRKNYYK